MTLIKSFMSSVPDENWDKAFGKKELDKIAEDITAMAEQVKQEEQLTNEC